MEAKNEEYENDEKLYFFTFFQNRKNMEEKLESFIQNHKNYIINEHNNNLTNFLQYIQSFKTEHLESANYHDMYENISNFFSNHDKKILKKIVSILEVNDLEKNVNSQQFIDDLLESIRKLLLLLDEFNEFLESQKKKIIENLPNEGEKKAILYDENLFLFTNFFENKSKLLNKFEKILQNFEEKKSYIEIKENEEIIKKNIIVSNLLEEIKRISETHKKSENIDNITQKLQIFLRIDDNQKNFERFLDLLEQGLSNNQNKSESPYFIEDFLDSFHCFMLILDKFSIYIFPGQNTSEIDMSQHSQLYETFSRIRFQNSNSPLNLKSNNLENLEEEIEKKGGKTPKIDRENSQYNLFFIS